MKIFEQIEGPSVNCEAITHVTAVETLRPTHAGQPEAGFAVWVVAGIVPIRFNYRYHKDAITERGKLIEMMRGVKV